MKINLHTHTTWCDGSASVREMACAALAKGFVVLGFSSHAMLPGDPEDWPLKKDNIRDYAKDVRAVAEEFKGKLEIRLGVEADFVPGISFPDRKIYSMIEPDFIIGSIHYLIAPDGVRVGVDKSPEAFQSAIMEHFGGSVEAFCREYFARERQMAEEFDFDIIGHPDLVRKFNEKIGLVDENAAWYKEEIAKTADVFARSGKIVEINTGAISRAWLDDAYPSAEFRALLAARGVKFILSSDAHFPEALDCAFDRF
ncbi:MAG: histidinol-phosphatase [Kiritimatiellae bacterium]|nr:histidinol-phosphatase [Kiritimatiellia bacterium]